MQRLDVIKEKNVAIAMAQFVFPFSCKSGSEQSMFSFLHEHHFKAFRLDHLEDEHAYYGKFCVSHRDMEAYYVSFTNQMLFPHSEHQKGLQRYSKALNFKCRLKTELIDIPFQIHSIDVTLCPYELELLVDILKSVDNIEMLL